MRVPYALSVYDEEEIGAVSDTLRQRKSIIGPKTTEFEAKVAELFGKQYGIMVNSGSSANLLAIELLNLKQGSEVVTPVLTFATTIAPLLQKGLVPKFVDVETATYQADLSQVRDATDSKTGALMIPSLIGNVPDYRLLNGLAKERGIPLVEDSCDTLGATIGGVPTGKYSDMSTTSFYGSHIITAAGGGGMICLNDKKLATRCKVLRGWGRSSAVDESESIEKRFSVKLEGITYDTKYIFDEVGYNFLPLEISSSFGLVQLRKLADFRKTRQRNFSRLMKFFTKYKEFFTLPRQISDVDTAWLAFPLTINEGAPFKRIDVVTELEKKDIQTRPIFTGNILRQPGFKGIKMAEFRKDFPNADAVMERGFLVGCNNGLGDEHLSYMETALKDFLDKY